MTEPKPSKLMNKHNPKQQIGWFCPKCKKVSEFKENIEKHIKEKHEVEDEQTSNTK